MQIQEWGKWGGHPPLPPTHTHTLAVLHMTQTLNLSDLALSPSVPCSILYWYNEDTSTWYQVVKYMRCRSNISCSNGGWGKGTRSDLSNCCCMGFIGIFSRTSASSSLCSSARQEMAPRCSGPGKAFQFNILPFLTL